MKKMTLLILGLLFSSAALWAVPSQITFQGTLKKSGVPVNATKNMQFSFVDGSGSTIPGTTPVAIANVAVVNGLFAVQLPIDASVAWAQYTPFVRVSVEGQILSPDQPINASLYAVQAIPAGIIAPFGGSTPPPGWLLCDGSSKNRTTYSALFTAISTAWGNVDGSSFNVPDLRGRVPMGAGQGTGLSLRILGSTLGEEEHRLTVNEMPTHSHAAPPGQNFALVGSLNDRGIPGGGAAAFSSSLNMTDSAGGSGSHNIIQPSAVVNYIIKY